MQLVSVMLGRSVIGISGEAFFGGLCRVVAVLPRGFPPFLARMVCWGRGRLIRGGIEGNASRRAMCQIDSSGIKGGMRRAVVGGHDVDIQVGIPNVLGSGIIITRSRPHLATDIKGMLGLVRLLLRWMVGIGKAPMELRILLPGELPMRRRMLLVRNRLRLRLVKQRAIRRMIGIVIKSIQWRQAGRHLLNRQRQRRGGEPFRRSIVGVVVAVAAVAVVVGAGSETLLLKRQREFQRSSRALLLLLLLRVDARGPAAIHECLFKI